MNSERFNSLLMDWPQHASEQNAREVYRFAMKTLNEKRDFGRLYATAGITEALCEQGFLRDTWRRRMSTSFALWMLNRIIQSQPDRPGVNDFLMAKWLITRRPEIVQQLRRRCEIENEIGYTCRWMVDSVRQRNSEFASQLGE